ncbi:MAG: DUF4388 domain-containing protein, partial [Thermoanaerobaculia bacterium]
MTFEGEINEIELIPRLLELGSQHFTGAIRFENDAFIKIIYFKDGNVLSASTNDRSDSIDEILLRGGKVTREHLKQALARRKENETLGDALLTLGFITRKELTWARRVQVVGVIRSILQWQSGSYTIVQDYLPKREEGTFFLLPHVILELLVTSQDREAIEKEMEGGSVVFAAAPDFDATYRTLGLNQDADRITALVDGNRSADEIASSSANDSFTVYKLLYALEVLGLIRAKPKVTHQVSPPAFRPPSSLDQLSFEDEPALEIGPGAALDMAGEPAAVKGGGSGGLDVGTPSPELRTPLQSAPAAAPASSGSVRTPSLDDISWEKGSDPAADPTLEMGLPDLSRDSGAESLSWNEPVEIPNSLPEPDQSFPTPNRAAGFTPSSVAQEKGGSRTFLYVLLAIVVLGAGGYFGFRWWSGRGAVAPAPPSEAAGIRPPAEVAVHPPAANLSPVTTSVAEESG